MMYTLNLHSDVCQLHLSKTGIKKKKQHLKFQSIVSPCGRVGGSLCLQVKGFWFHVAPGGTFNIPGCGVPTVAQKVTNPTSIHEDAGSIPGLTQWQESGVAVSCSVGHRRGSDPALLWLWHRVAAAALIRPLAWEVPYATRPALKSKKKRKKQTNKQTKNQPTNQPTKKPIPGRHLYDEVELYLEICNVLSKVRVSLLQGNMMFKSTSHFMLLLDL